MEKFEVFYLKSQINQFESLVESMYPEINVHDLTLDVLMSEGVGDLIKQGLGAAGQFAKNKIGPWWNKNMKAPQRNQQPAPQPNQQPQDKLTWGEKLAAYRGSRSGKQEVQKSEKIDQLINRYKKAYGNDYQSKLPDWAKNYDSNKANANDLVQKGREQGIAQYRQSKAEQEAAKLGKKYGFQQPAPQPNQQQPAPQPNQQQPAPQPNQQQPAPQPNDIVNRGLPGRKISGNSPKNKQDILNHINDQQQKLQKMIANLQSALQSLQQSP